MTSTLATGTEMNSQGNSLAVWALTEKGCNLGLLCLAKMPGATLFVPKKRNVEPEKVKSFSSFSGAVKQNFNLFDGHVFILATGIVVRVISTLLQDKTVDPAVVVLDENGSFSISLLSGHLGGGNHLASRLATMLGAQAVITTATDCAGILAFDSLAVKIGAKIEDKEKIKITSSCLIHSAPVALVENMGITEAYYKAQNNITHFSKVDEHALAGYEAVCVVSDKLFNFGDALLAKTLFLRPPVLHIGIGCNSGTSADEIERGVRAVLKTHNLSILSVAGVASVDKKASEKGLLLFVERNKWGVVFFEVEKLNNVSHFLLSAPSKYAMKYIGAKGVAEPAALLSAGNGARLVVPKHKIGNITVAIAESKDSIMAGEKGKIFLVGIGPGNTNYMTAHAHKAIESSEVVAGYTSYINSIKHLLDNKEIISTGMTREIDRVEQALDVAASGRNISLVCSGDTGVYGLAGLVFETIERLNLDVDVEISPGVTAAVSAASLAGAPLINDFIVISLSDLLTPKETVISRIKTAAASDMVTVVYNPKSKKRLRLIELLKEEFLKCRGIKTPVAVVTHALREGQEAVVSTLANFLELDINMNSILIIGNSDTVLIGGHMVTKRGYERKLTKTSIPADSVSDSC